jgi:uncharacterized protein (DUF1501 family)
MVGCSAAIAAMTGGWVSNLSFAAPGDTTERDMLVVVFLRGGCDGLSIIAPVDDPNYVVARGDLRIAESGTNAGYALNNALPGADFRLNQRGAPFKELYDAGRLAVIHACGLTNGTRSHFEAMDYMERGQPDGSGSGTGWLARHLLSISPGGLLPAIAAQSSTPDSLLGTSSAVALTDANNFRLRGNSNTYTPQMQSALQEFYSGGSPLLQAGQTTLSAIQAVSDNIPRGSNGNPLPYTPEYGADYPTGAGNSLSNALRTVARLIKMDVGLQVATVDYGGWDTHENERLPESAGRARPGAARFLQRPLPLPATAVRCGDERVRPAPQGQPQRRHRPRARQCDDGARRRHPGREDVRELAGTRHRAARQRRGPEDHHRLPGGAGGAARPAYGERQSRLGLPGPGWLPAARADLHAG